MALSHDNARAACTSPAAVFARRRVGGSTLAPTLPVKSVIGSAGGEGEGEADAEEAARPLGAEGDGDREIWCVCAFLRNVKAGRA